MPQHLRRGILTKASFVQLSNANIPGWATVGTYQVPRAVVNALRADLPFYIKLATRQTFQLSASAGRTSYTVTLGFAFPDPPWLPSGAKVYAEFVESGVVTASGVTAYNAATGSVTANVTANAGELRIDVLMPAGNLRILKFRPVGFGGRRERMIWSRPVRVLADVDQNRSPQSWQGDHVLAQEWGLRMELLSSYEISWASPLTEISIPFEELALTDWLRQTGIRPDQLEQALAVGW